MTGSRANPTSPARAGSSPLDPRAHEPPRRRRFSALYKAWIVDEASAARDPGAVGALLRVPAFLKRTQKHLDMMATSG